MRDATLVDRARSGDAVAFGELAERSRPWLRALCSQRVGDPWAVDDLVQEALILAFRDLGHLRDSGAFRPWLSQIARNVCRMHLRRRLIRPEVLMTDSPPLEPGSMVQTSLMLPKGEDYDLLRGHYLDGLSVKELATKLSVSTSAVKSRLHRARVRLRKELGAMREGQAREWSLRTVLLAEPEDALREAISRELRGAGYEVVALPTGAAAIQAVQAQRGQLLILDTRVADPHWLEVAGLVRTDAYGLTNVPVCVLIGPEQADRELRLAWHTGAEVCLSRPPDIACLLAYISRLRDTWGSEEG